VANRIAVAAAKKYLRPMICTKAAVEGETRIKDRGGATSLTLSKD
jgi:hypothetical protein